MDQKIEAMSDEDAARIEKQRSWVRDHFEPQARSEYDNLSGKLRLIQSIIAAGWIEPSETWKLQSLGVAFGDALAQALGLAWVTVEDEYGRDPALQVPSTTILVFPLTAISKRIERGDKVEVVDLFNSAMRTVQDARQKGA